MKTMTRILSFILFIVLTSNVNAQDGYTYTLIDNGNYSYTVAAVPNASSNNFATSVQSYGFTITVPDGITLSIVANSSLGNAAGATPFDGSAVGDASIDGYLITETLGSPVSLPAPSAGTPSAMVTVQMSQPVAPGSISVLANNSALATTVTLLKSFMQADMIDDATAAFTNMVGPVGPAVSGTSTIMFSTLGVTTEQLEGISIFPNPVKEVLNIRGLENDLSKVEMYNITGQKVMTTVNNMEAVNVGALSNGVYFVKLYVENASKTIKDVKE